MKATVSRKELNDALMIAASASSQRTPQGILGSIRVDAKDGTLNLLGCDGELYASASCPAQVASAGSACVPQQLFSQIVGALPDGECTLELEGTSMCLRQNESDWRMTTLLVDDFPAMPEVQQTSSLTLPFSELKAAVEGVAFAVSDDFSNRLVLTGVLFSYDGSTLTMVATDTHRLAVNRIHRGGIGSSLTVIVSGKALKTIRALPVADDADLSLSFDESRVSVNIGSAQVVSQLLTGQYPNWERVVPQEFTRVWTVDKGELYDNIKRAMILAKDTANRIRFSGNGDKVVISARSEDKGEAKEEVSVVGKNGDLEIAFNGRYVMDALQAMKSDGIRAEMTESSRPAVLRPTEGGDDHFCVVMPMAMG